MAYTTVYQGIVFVEGTHNSAQLGKNIETDLSFCINEQLKSLRNVKNNLCEQAKHYGYNAIVNFTYGQRFSYWSFDSVVFWGKGTLANIPVDEYSEICSRN